ncbi:xanthine dehydrogenase family protein molybdopterin-binding subunit [Anaeromyxobacter oryzae]|uniref:Carbon monoxide dehydrogenase n=1 Tax=Anaeromyxobacter oryzae TaxID=2918170 RepID=A0ABN6N2S0_9BACT|nr:xanthine dehydrogenase family protein molybdopterin-binding subunit [Anaeromyxobacter oryzae]BDG06163.1 carbon monoxide dehydrogenase [Anaeromyxobacter oryzae]
MAKDGIGAAVLRKEDRRFLTGAGTYTDDLTRPRQTFAHFVRSPHAHARIGAIRADAARAAPGVLAVLTGADLAADRTGNIPTGWLIHSKDGSPMAEPPHPALAQERVRHVGDPVAMIVAETKDQAREAAALLEVDYEELPAVATLAQAMAPGAPLVWEQAKGNVCFDFQLGDAAATDAAFAKAFKVVSLDLVNNRLVPNAIEPRAAIGEYDRATGDFTLWTTSQNPHLTRLLLGAFTFGVPEHKLRVVAPDVGGGFGSKIPHYAEEMLVLWAARKIGRPVRWTALRSESFMSDAHGRDHLTHAELAVDRDGTFLGLRVRTAANMGAYLSTFAPAIPTYLHATLLAGCYRTPAIHAEVKAIFTNTVPVDAYRGAGRPEAAFVVERLADLAARELGVDRVEIRRRNFIDRFPYQTPVALQYDAGNYFATLDTALDRSRWQTFEERRAEARTRGKLRGIGISTYVEACGIAPSALVGALGARAGLYESAGVRVHPTGSVTVFTGTHSHGQGHETTFAQIVADQLGIPVDSVEVVHGDTSRIPFGMGTYGSRSLAVGGSALVKATEKIVAKARKIAAHLLEASEGDVELRDGRFVVAGTDRAKTFGEVALAAYVPHKYPAGLEPGLEETAFYDPKNFTFPAGCHVCEVEIDPDTGQVQVVAFTVVDDVGNVVNPMIVDGQIHGGVTQGIGQALLEGCLYDDAGQLLSGSLLAYTMPRASDLPSYDVGTHVTACTHNPLGAKGVGEVGAIGAPAAVIGAVVDALADLGVRHVDMPATPERVWRIIRDAQAKSKV